MSTLFWKEWHEQAWKLGFGGLLLGTLAALAFHARLLADETTAMWICFIGITLLPIVSSIGLISAERADGTLEMLLALPVRSGRVLLVKAIVGLLLVAVPMLVAAGITLLITGAREVPIGSMSSLYLRAIAAAVMLFLWMLALTTRLPSEARAALIAVGVLIIWELTTVGLTHPALPSWSVALSPFGFVYDATEGFVNSPPLVGVVLMQLLISSTLWLWTLRQFGPSDSVE